MRGVHLHRQLADQRGILACTRPERSISPSSSRTGHGRVSRYPIVARWRDDVFFTQASIYDFQPWVLNEVIEPPANPL